MNRDSPSPELMMSSNQLEMLKELLVKENEEKQLQKEKELEKRGEEARMKEK